MNDDVTVWIQEYVEGDEAAAQKLWEKYFHKLVRLARNKLDARSRRVADEEDIALSAMKSFFRGAEQGRFPQLDDRDDLWKVLVTITLRKGFAQIRRETRQKRGGGKTRGESVFEAAGADDLRRGIEAAFGDDPTPETAALLAEACEQKLAALDDEMLRQIALLKMEGYTNDEIANQLGCVTRTVERKLERIRRKWSEELPGRD